MREFKRTLAAGQQDSLASNGSYVYYKAGAGDIRIITSTGNDVVLKEGHGVRFDRPFTKIDVQNVGDLPLTFSLMIGDGDFQNNRMVGNIEVEGGIDVKNVVDVKVKGGIDVKNIVDVKPAGGSIAVGAKSVGSLLPVKTYNNIPARTNREKLLINYFNNRPHVTEGLVSVFFIVVKVDGVPLTFFAPYGESGSIEINTTKALTVEFFDNYYNYYNYDNDNGSYNNNSHIAYGGKVSNNNNNDYNSGNNNYSAFGMFLSIVEVLND